MQSHAERNEDPIDNKARTQPRAKARSSPQPKILCHRPAAPRRPTNKDGDVPCYSPVLSPVIFFWLDGAEVEGPRGKRKKSPSSVAGVDD